MEKKFIVDPWARTTTRNGLAGDEVISALQKSIRRGNVEAACEFAYEMYITSPQMEENFGETYSYLCRRYRNGRPYGCCTYQ